MISITTWIGLIAPQFASNASLSEYVAAAAEQLDVATWGGAYNQAVALLACHYMQLAANGAAGGGGAAGAVASRKAGDVSIGYGASSSAAGTGYDLTIYGQQFVALRGELACTGPRLAGPVIV